MDLAGQIFHRKQFESWNWVFYLNCLWTIITLVSHSYVVSEAFRHGNFSTWIALSFGCLLWSWTAVITACGRSPAPCRSHPSSFFISSRAWRRVRLWFCQGRAWMERELLEESWLEWLQELSPSLLPSWRNKYCTSYPWWHYSFTRERHKYHLCGNKNKFPSLLSVPSTLLGLKEKTFCALQQLAVAVHWTEEMKTTNTALYC